ncbi:MAG: acyltransferase [Spirochaetia bacterium]|nr:acyltransferase [Spirochaetia bacterium]
MKIGFYQFVPEFGNTQKNIATMVDAVRNADADLVVFPELATSGYLFLKQDEVAAVAESVPGPASRAFSAVAVETDTAVVVGFPEKCGDVYYNSAMLATPDGRVQVYRKNHLYNEEKLFFQPGDLGFPVFEVKGIKIGLLICFDHMFPESARCLALQGVQIVCHAANLVLPEYAQITSRSRALENKIFWILANRCGSESRGGKFLSYSGRGQIVDPNGQVMVSAGPDDTGFFSVDIDPETANKKRLAPLCDVFEDRRPELYNLLTEKRM